MTYLCGTLFEKIIFRASLARKSFSENFTTANKIQKKYIKLLILTAVHLKSFSQTFHPVQKTIIDKKCPKILNFENSSAKISVKP